MRKRTREKRELKARLEEKQHELDVSNATLDAMLKKFEGDEQDSVKDKDKGGDCPRPERKMQAAKIAREAQSLQRAPAIATRTGKGWQKEGGGAGIPRSRHFYVNKEICGYRRIRAALERAGQAISEKVIRAAHEGAWP